MLRSVSRFEYDLVRLLRAVLRRDPVEPALELIRRPPPRPRCLSRAAVELVEQSLRNGAVALLARDGWKPARHAADRGDRVVSGRLWRRHPLEALSLSYSPRALNLLMTLLGPPATEAAKTWEKLAPRPGTPLGDRLLAIWSFEALADSDLVVDRAGAAVFSEEPLLQLMHPDRFVGESIADPSAWFGPDRAWVIEAWQPKIARRLVQAERHKGTIRDWRDLRALGEFQGQVLDAWLDAAGHAGRFDLAEFLLDAGAQLFGDDQDADPTHWVGALRRDGLRLADRTAAYQGALALARRMERLRAFDQQCRGVGYLDEGYAGAQLYLGLFERYRGATACTRARELIHRLDPLGGDAAHPAPGAHA